jgi:hypothetical protein
MPISQVSSSFSLDVSPSATALALPGSAHLENLTFFSLLNLAVADAAPLIAIEAGPTQCDLNEAVQVQQVAVFGRSIDKFTEQLARSLRHRRWWSSSP